MAVEHSQVTQDVLGIAQELIDLAEEYSKLISDAIYSMERLSQENDHLIKKNKLLLDDNRRLQSLVTSQRTEIDTLKEELGL